mgnify:CR=1 FL=1
MTAKNLVSSVCPHDCPSTCALEVELQDEHTIGRIHGADDNNYTCGVICEKVARYAERIHNPQRLTEPLRRTGGKGAKQFHPISWDDALDGVAEAFLKAEQRLGSETVWPYYYAGTMGLVMRDGINRLRHVKGYSGMHATFCATLAIAGWKAGTGSLSGTDPREMAESDLIVVWGTNAAATQVNVMHHISRARRERGAKLVVIDPYRNATAKTADVHLCLRPGTDGALACAVMHVLFAEGYADREYLENYTDVPDELESHLKTRTPAWASQITGLEEADIIEFAQLYGETKRSFIRLGFGFSRSRNGAINMHAASCLAAVTGSWQHLGGGAFFNNAAIYHWDKTLIEGLDSIDPNIRVLDQSRIGPVLTGEKSDLGKGPPVTAMLIQSTNPMNVAPDLNKVYQGLTRKDLFVCVHEQFMTETAQLADIVLPATTFLEHDDLYQGGGHMFIQIGAKVIEPPPQCRSNHELICALAKRLGAEHRGFDMTSMEIIDETLQRSDWPDAETIRGQRWLDCQPDFRTAHFLNGFSTPDRKFHFAPNWQREGPSIESMPRLPDHVEITEETSPEHPLRLVTAPARTYLNSSFTETPGSRKREGRPVAMFHPTTARNLGITEGGVVRLGNQRGEVVLHAQIFDGLQPDTVIVESIHPNSSFLGTMGINTLTGSDAAPPNGGAPYHDSSIWAKPENST